ncbi:MAG: pentapeptide repeat-containing protein [Myxococcota bacterium]
MLGGFLNITAPLSTADYLEDRIQSPERAQLFVALQTTRVSFENIGRNADFSFVVLDKLDLSNSDFRTVRMRNSVLSESNIAYTTFKDGVFSGSDFTGARGLSNNFTGCDLTNADFSQALVNNSNFSNALLQGGRFNNANLIQAVFAGPLENASFEGANLDGANFRDVTDVENAAFGNALIERLNAPPELIEQLKARGATSDFSVWRDRTEANWLP